MENANDPPLRKTMDDALRGVAGVDFFPAETCPVCGGVMWFDGKRMQQTHDMRKHGVLDDTSIPDASPARTRTMTRAAESLQRGVRRSLGERDDDE